MQLLGRVKQVIRITGRAGVVLMPKYTTAAKDANLTTILRKRASECRFGWSLDS